MRLFKATVLVTGLLASASYASALDLGAVCCDGGYEYRNRNRFEAGKAGDDMAGDVIWIAQVTFGRSCRITRLECLDNRIVRVFA